MLTIIVIGVIVFCVGGAVAYYNTSSFGYDNANLLTFQEDAVKILDFTIPYNTLREAMDTIKKVLPEQEITI